MHRDSSSPQGTSAPAASEQPIVGRRARGEKVSPPVLTDPLNHPESASPRLRARRAWSLLALSLLLPGSAQLVQGNRTLGRRALAVTGLVWALVLTLLALWFLNRSWVLTLATNSWSLWIATLAFAALALGWVFILLDTYRLMKPGLLTGRSKPLVSLALIATLFITGGGLGYAAYITWLGRGALSSIFAGGTPLQEQDGRYNILLMGGDAGEDRVGRRPDSMTVVSIDATTGQAITISVPRNLQNAIFETGSPLWSIYPEGFNCGDECILNALYPTVSRDYPDLYPEADDPGAEATMDAVSGVLGITVENYILIDMSGFEQLIDALGGIIIDVGGRVPIGGGTNEFTGLPNPIDGYIEPGRQHLDGFHALWYARSREGATDYDRQARQRCVQAAMLKQLDPANVLTKFADITAAGEQVIETNIPQGGLASLGNVALKSKNYALIQFAAGPPYFGEMFPTYPDFDLLHQRVQQVIADSSQGIQPEATPLASSTGQQQPADGVTIVTVSQKTLLAAETDPATGLSENGTCSVP